MFTYNLSFFLTSTAFVDANTKIRHTAFEIYRIFENCPLGYTPIGEQFFSGKCKKIKTVMVFSLILWYFFVFYMHVKLVIGDYYSLLLEFICHSFQNVKFQLPIVRRCHPGACNYLDCAIGKIGDADIWLGLCQGEGMLCYSV